MMSKKAQKIVVYLMLFAMLASTVLAGLAWLL
ncbi:stressosome-associated protein Prli42 [Heyndrickxia vini]|uniref:Stressosome-associated protein Prli42 n=1 Tax=Heyndrickxia vini TaxID=1476025 RepID=A0ABX7E6Y2_9BACI|nr:stressosome-associated protein Prli42 [Heyndrickxia vini]QQZ11478.1 stressosome-associated protein Prli42 [Heyndrickxia vini]